MRQVPAGPVTIGLPTEPGATGAAHAGRGVVSSGTVIVCTPGGGGQRNTHTPLTCATSEACNGPASSPASAVVLAVLNVSMPAIGVITQQVSPATARTPGPKSGRTRVRPENRPTTPWDAITSAEAGM